MMSMSLLDCKERIRIFFLTFIVLPYSNITPGGGPTFKQTRALSGKKVPNRLLWQCSLLLIREVFT